MKMKETLLIPKPRAILEKIEPYVPGKPVEEVKEVYKLSKVVKMASNENPWGPSPKAIKRVLDELQNVATYPEGSCALLREALARKAGVAPDMITVSNGGDNVLSLIAHAFLEPGDQAVMATPTFPIYKTAVLVAGAEPVEVPLKAFTHDLRSMAKAVTPKTKVVFVCNPNNPTGTIVQRKELLDFLECLPESVLVVLDEVYGDFADPASFPDGLVFIREGRPIVSVRSFSKLYGLAGLRVGYAVGRAELIEAINRVREPFPVNRLAQAAALGALEDEEFREFVIAQTRKERERLASALREMGLRCLDSHTNFLFVDLKRDSQGVFEALLSKGIIIRPGRTWGTPTWCRITVGRQEDNEQLLSALREVLG